MDKHDPVQMAADVNWQIAKGHLRAVVAVHGALKHPVPTDEGGRTKYERMNEAVEDFIKVVEEDELHL